MVVVFNVRVAAKRCNRCLRAPVASVHIVVVHVSSMNTSFSTFIVGRDSRSQARHAACTSSRSCSLAVQVFFESKIPLSLMPHAPV